MDSCRNKFCSAVRLVAILACHFFLSQETCSWICGTGLGKFWMFRNRKGCALPPELVSTNFQPVMFDVDLFGGKKGFPIPSTTYQATSHKYQAPSAKGQSPIAKYQVPSTKYKVPSTNHQVPTTKYQSPSTMYRVRKNLYLVRKNLTFGIFLRA